jgi:hypothetical protein
MTASAAVGTFIAAAMSSRWNLTAYGTIIASALQVVGYGLTTTLDDEREISASIYGYQVILGVGFGMSIASTTILILLRFFNKPQYLGNQFLISRSIFATRLIIPQPSCKAA